MKLSLPGVLRVVRGLARGILESQAMVALLATGWGATLSAGAETVI